MAEIFWPEQLPQFPQRSTFRETLPNNTAAYKPDYGPVKTRRRTSANTKSHAGVYYLQENSIDCASGEVVNQPHLFRSFYEIVDCDLSFWLPDPTKPSRYIKVKIKGTSERDGPEIVLVGADIWSVTLQLEVWPHAEYPRG